MAGGKRGGGKRPQGRDALLDANVSADFKAWLSTKLEEFALEDDPGAGKGAGILRLGGTLTTRSAQIPPRSSSVLEFPASLTSEQRKYAHGLTTRMGLVSKSVGTGTNRQVIRSVPGAKKASFRAPTRSNSSVRRQRP